MTIWTVPPLWQNGECWILGGGASIPQQFSIPTDIVTQVMAGKLSPSAYSSYLSTIHNKHVIGVNNAYMIGTWIDIAFFGDAGWYLIHRTKFAEFPNLKVTCCNRFEKRIQNNMEGIKYLKKDPTCTQGITKNKSCVSWNNNSGAAAISLAAHLGVQKIYLLGFDMKLEHQVSHWHGTHNREKKIIPPFWRHLRGFPLIASHAKERGITIINCSPNSAITCFTKMTVEEALHDSK